MGKLFRIKGFLPYVVMLFLNAFVDLGHKIVIQNTVFKIYDGQLQVILTAIVNALILLPYIFLFSPAGYISDKYPKHFVMRYSAMAEVFTVMLVIAAYFYGWFWLAFLLTLLMAIQSAVYSPAKYGYIRELAGDEHLAAANGVVQAATIIAILGGTLVFSACFEWMLRDVVLLSPGQILQSIYPLGFLILLLAIMEFVLAFYLPARREIDRMKSFSLADYVHGKYLKTNIEAITSTRIIWLSIVGLLVFWAASQVVLASFPAFAKHVLQETNTLVIQGILASTGIGIMAGSLFAGRVSRYTIETSLIPVGVAGFSLLIGVIPLLHSALAMAGVFVLIGFFGGIYIVPLNALMQYHAPANDIGTVLAGNNWVQNIVMFLALGVTIVLAYLGIDSIGLFYCLMLVCFAFAVYITCKLPQVLARFVQWFVSPLRKVEVQGLAHLPQQAGVLLTGVFNDWTDFALLQIACPAQVHFVVSGNTGPGFFRKPIYRWFGITIFQGSNIATLYQDISTRLQAGEWVYLPEDEMQGYKQWLENPEGKARLVNVYIVPFYLGFTETADISGDVPDDTYANTRASVTGRQYRRARVILGEPCLLYVDIDSLKLQCSGLVFQWRQYMHENDPAVCRE